MFSFALYWTDFKWFDRNMFTDLINHCLPVFTSHSSFSLFVCFDCSRSDLKFRAGLTNHCIKSTADRSRNINLQLICLRLVFQGTWKGFDLTTTLQIQNAVARLVYTSAFFVSQCRVLCVSRTLWRVSECYCKLFLSPSFTCSQTHRHWNINSHLASSLLLCKQFCGCLFITPICCSSRNCCHYVRSPQ